MTPRSSAAHAIIMERIGESKDRVAHHFRHSLELELILRYTA